MDRAILKKDIAELAYNVTYGANRHFATFDIVSRLPAWIGFASLAFGIVGLAFKVTTNLTSVVFILLSIAALFITMYEPKKADYEMRGVQLTKLSGQLLSLYRKAETDEPDVLQEVNQKFLELKDAYYSDGGNIGQQILFSDVLAHYKMFGVKKQQSQWFVDELNLTLFRDKIPFFILLISSLAVLATVIYGLYKLFACHLTPYITQYFC
ncbi:SLATT domain-containing protein [Vibrio cholerae]|uniref:SLATT domain-containing protein n=1 Tax=Vibrio TaxID=662 RepID=UPI001A32AA1A|nr:SLATT domain-containing protein [Vibrio harveyi]EIA0835995.1 SLATT domain-containing protein [Vibrio parahaemolyticus]EIK2267026.1 SLATT domain-containing protein [Vibrio cholerae]ELI9681040.1 SLATT domain-containing protein [Vibrio vulnificus]ELX4196105.1 SLATT domain-containing protein [Vibrio vulnificus]HAS8107357.1 SLATT domain-containing protein [Vibrio vulnificus]